MKAGLLRMGVSIMRMVEVGESFLNLATCSGNLHKL